MRRMGGELGILGRAGVSQGEEAEQMNLVRPLHTYDLTALQPFEFGRTIAIQRLRAAKWEVDAFPENAGSFLQKGYMGAPRGLRSDSCEN